jgi:hypothetical protein
VFYLPSRVTGQERALPNIMVYTDETIIWKLNGSALEKTFQSIVTVCKEMCGCENVPEDGRRKYNNTDIKSGVL